MHAPFLHCDSDMDSQSVELEPHGWVRDDLARLRGTHAVSSWCTASHKNQRWYKADAFGVTLLVLA